RFEGLLGNVAFQAPNERSGFAIDAKEASAGGGKLQLPRARVADRLAAELGLEHAEAFPRMAGPGVGWRNAPQVKVVALRLRGGLTCKLGRVLPLLDNHAALDAGADVVAAAVAEGLQELVRRKQLDDARVLRLDWRDTLKALFLHDLAEVVGRLGFDH